MEYKDDMEEKYYRQIRKNWDRIAKPLDGMGIFEHITAKNRSAATDRYAGH